MIPSHISGETRSRPRNCDDTPFTNVNGKKAVIAESLNGAAVFLVGSGPSFLDLDYTRLQEPGCLTMGVNNSPKTLRPDMWVSVDDPSHFLHSIWVDPRIQKFARSNFRDSHLYNSEARSSSILLVKDCPNLTLFKADLDFKVDDFLTSPSVSWGMEGNCGGRSVLLAALKILHHLGARNVFLLGVDFEMSSHYTYHFEQSRDSSSIKGNLSTYRILSKRLATLKPRFEEDQFYVWNCNPKSKLNVFPFYPFDAAVDFAQQHLPVSSNSEPTAGLYDREHHGDQSSENSTQQQYLPKEIQDRSFDRSKRPTLLSPKENPLTKEDIGDSGILLFADANMEWLLPWWFHHFKQSHTSCEVALVDGGITIEAKQWLSERAIPVIPLAVHEISPHLAWFHKPFAIAISPFARTVFCDLDCEIRGDLEPLFTWCEQGIVLGEDPFPIGKYRKLFRIGNFFNSGLIGVRKESEVIQKWCDETIQLHDGFRSDQEILNLVLHEQEMNVVVLPEHFHQIRLSGDHKDSQVMHWTGEPGKDYIRSQITKLKVPPIC